MTPEDERRPISFRDWPSVLAAAQLPPAREREFRRAILRFLHHCKTARAPATIVLARQYLGAREGGAVRDALRWFVTQGRASLREALTPSPVAPATAPRLFESTPPQGSRPSEPPRAAQDR